MFNFFKKKTTKFTVTAPIPGILKNLSEVKDPVFSQKMMGDGFAISLSSTATSVFAPVAGKIVSLPESHHFFSPIIKHTPLPLFQFCTTDNCIRASSQNC